MCFSLFCAQGSAVCVLVSVNVSELTVQTGRFPLLFLFNMAELLWFWTQWALVRRCAAFCSKEEVLCAPLFQLQPDPMTCCWTHLFELSDPHLACGDSKFTCFPETPSLCADATFYELFFFFKSHWGEESVLPNQISHSLIRIRKFSSAPTPPHLQTSTSPAPGYLYSNRLFLQISSLHEGARILPPLWRKSRSLFCNVFYV